MRFNFPLGLTQIAGPLVLLALSLLAYLFEPAASDWFAYNRYQIQGMELWRLVTANLLHTNFSHLMLNTLGLVLLWALHGDEYKVREYLNAFIVCSFCCTVGMFFLSTDLIWYVGLSGALHGLFVWGACLDIRKGLRSGWLLLSGVALKIVYEQSASPNLELEALIDAKVAIDAHLYGAIGGLIYSSRPPLTALLMFHKRFTAR